LQVLVALCCPELVLLNKLVLLIATLIVTIRYFDDECIQDMFSDQSSKAYTRCQKHWLVQYLRHQMGCCSRPRRQKKLCYIDRDR